MNNFTFPLKLNDCTYEIACTSIDDESAGMHYFIKVYREKVRDIFYRSFHLIYKNRQFSYDSIEYPETHFLLNRILAELKNQVAVK